MGETRVAARPRGRIPGGQRERNIRTTLIPVARPVAAVEPAVAPAQHAREHLLQILGVGDAVAVLAGFYAVVLLVSGVRPGSLLEWAFQITVITAIGLFAIRSQGLWVERLIAVRVIELSRLTRAVVVMGLGVLLADRGARLYFHVEHAMIACVTVWLALVGWRSVYRAWLAAQRKAGRYTRRVIIVGTDRRAITLAELFATHPETGVRVIGLVGSAREARAAGFSDLWVANYADADRVLAAADVDGVVLCASDINPALLEVLIRGERARSRDLYLDPGLSGIDFRRVQALPIAHQPLLYVEAPSLSRLQLNLKHAFDAVVSLGMLVVLAPVLAAIAIAIKLEDGGPVLFRQRRVGRDGVEFGMLKFRSMCVDAESRLAALRTANERTGPLFKLDGGDPRVTRIGQFLRATSLDELPQLLNVVRGDMSLVGPRPALAAEVAQFPEELQARHQVRPGITGLWQVEARDNPSFEAYRRLDLFYVENWSLALDLLILLGTVEQVLLRPLLSRRGAAAPQAEASGAVAA